MADPLDAVLGGPDSGSAMPNGIAGGASWTWTVPADAKAGTVWYYHCMYHGQPGDGKSQGTGMAGTITVK
jgi:hypothetical protein